MTISSFNAVFDSSVSRDCCERYSANLLCALRTTKGYHLISSDASDVKKIYPLALRILAGFAAFTLLLPCTMLGAVLHQFSTTHRTNYARYIAQHCPQTPTQSIEQSVSLGQSQSALQQKKTNNEALSLIKDFPPGVFRKGNGQGAEVSNSMIGDRVSEMFFITQEQELSLLFTCCFHTIEKQEEIWAFIKNTCQSNDPTGTYSESYERLKNNLGHLWHALPGKNQAKSSKIYWNDQAAKVLLPYFFKNENVDMQTLIFMISAGESQKSDWHADNIDFTQQLQFVGIKGTESEHQPLISSVENQDKEANPLMLRAHAFTQRFKC